MVARDAFSNPDPEPPRTRRRARRGPSRGRDPRPRRRTPRRRLVAAGRDLPDLPALVGRRRRRRHRRPARHHPRLPHLRDLGVDAIWLSPFYTSPQADAGYDVADYRDIDPLFGTLADADAHDRDAPTSSASRCIVDLVPNHTSDEHAWFQAALAAGPGSARARALHVPRGPRRARRAAAEQLASRSSAAPAWTRVTEPDGTPGQWYLHLFDTKQPDFNWEHPEVRAEFRVDPAVLARPRRRRLPRRRRARPGQGAGPARHRGGAHDDARPLRARARPRAARGQLRRGGAADRPHEAQPDVGPGRRPRDLPRLAHDPRVLRHARPHPLRRGLGRAAGARRGLRPPGRDAPGVQLRLPRPPRGRRRPARRHRRRRCTPPTRSVPRRPGCCRTTTSCATRRVSATRRARLG